MALRIDNRLPGSPRPRPTRRGWTLALLAAAAVTGGAVGGAGALVQIGLLLLLALPLAWLAAWVNLRGIRCDRDAPVHVVAGSETALELRVRNAQRLWDAFAVEVEDALLPFAHRGVYLPWLRAGAAVRRRLATRFVRRGVIHSGSFTVRSEFPCGLCSASFRLPGPVSILVFPRPVLPKELRHLMDSELFEGEQSGSLARDWSGDFRGIRRFQPGDPIKAVHWPATARTGALLVRERDRPVPERYSILFHTYCPPGGFIWPETFEQSLELLAGLLTFCGERGVPVDLTASFHGWEPVLLEEPHDLAPVMEVLARAKHRPEEELGGLLQALHALPGKHSVFVLSNTPVKLWAHLLPELPRRVTCLDNADIRVRRPVFQWA